MSFAVRPAVPADAAALAACAAVTFPLACPPSSDPRDIQHFLETELSESRFAEHLGDPDRTILCVDLARPAMLRTPRNRRRVGSAATACS
jgi:hypothetical protein